MELGILESRSVSSDYQSGSVRGRQLPVVDDVNRVPSSTRTGEEPHRCCGEELRPFWAEDGRHISVCMRCGTEFTHNVRYNGSPWIGVDLDGTLAQEISQSEDADRIGDPIEPMMERVRTWLANGETVKIFTARAAIPRQIGLVKDWLKKHGLPDLEVTNAKDFRMIELWDDRAIQVQANSGEPVEMKSKTARQAKTTIKLVARRRQGGSLVSKLRMFFAL